MKRYSRITMLLLLTLSLVYAACRKDTSSLDSNKIPGVTFDTTGQSSLSVYQFENLVVKPKLNIQGIDEKDLDYSWRLTLVYNDTTTTEIGNERDLDAEIRFPPSDPGRELHLIYVVTDTKHDLKYIMNWRLTVRNNIGMGLVVAQTDGNGNSDLSHVMNPDITLAYNDESVKHNVFSSINGKYIAGDIKQMKYVKISDGNAIIALTNNSLTKISTLNYKQTAFNGELFFGPTTINNVQGIHMVYQNDVLAVNGQLHPTWMAISKKWGVPLDNTVKMPEVLAFNYFNPSATVNPYQPEVLVNLYNEEAGWFNYIGGLNSFSDRNPYRHPVQVGQAFNANNLPNKKNLAAGITVDKGFIHVLKDKTTSEVGIYLFNGGSYTETTIPPLPTAYFDISNAPGIQNATLFTMLDDQRLFYYVSGNKVYAVMYGGATPVVEERFSASGTEQITVMDIYRQADYPYSPSYLPTNNKLLLVGTHATEGKLYLFPMKNIGLGTLDIANAKSYGGFKKITAIASQL